MKITRDRLLNIAQTFINKRVRTDHSVVCVYLVGSMLNEDPFINGTTDVDLVFVHNISPDLPREIISVTPEVTLDLHHIDQNYYSPPRNVRKDPWVGSSLCFDPIVLYGKGHWFEFARASVEAGFFNPENIMSRSKQFLDQARNSYAAIASSAAGNLGNYPALYLKTLDHTVNALACLVQKPLTDRYLMRGFKEVADMLEQPELVADLHSLILGTNDPSPYYDYFFNSWRYYLEYFGNSGIAQQNNKFGKDRLSYYTLPVELFWNEHLTSALWIMSRSWSAIANFVQLDDNEYYNAFCSILEISAPFYPLRREQLEAFIDKAEETQIEWGKEHGYLDGDSY